MSGFRAELELALTHFSDVRWLGEHSPLAAPYLLGTDRIGSETHGDAHARGAVLRAVLSEAVAALPRREGPSDARTLLDLLFFDPPRHLNQAGLATRLGISPASLYRYRLEALDQLEAQVATRLQPCLSLEMPNASPLAGRQAELALGRSLLLASRHVGLTGSSGVGKTALASQLADEWPHRDRVFWFTLRPGVNDQVESLLYALAEFLRRHAEPALWMQLAAERGRIDPQLALSLAWSSFDRMSAQGAPLLCFDEADVLAPSMSETAARAALRHFLEGLVRMPGRGFAMLLIGQQILIEPDAHIHLDGLPEQVAAALLAQTGLALSSTDLKLLLAATGGNPLLLRLHALLHEGADDGQSAPPAMGASLRLSLPVLLSRVLRRLDETARQVMCELSVFDGPAPADAWRERQASLDHLLGRGLAQADAGSGVVLQPALRDAVLTQLSPELRARLESQAAGVRLARGEVTAAVLHLLRADQPAAAVRLWFAHRQMEIERGQGGVALAVFAGLSRDRLKPDEQRMLISLRSELRALSGDAEAAVEDLASVAWRASDALTPRALELHGDMLVLLGRDQHAPSKYAAALEATDAQLARKRVQLRAKLAGVHRVRRNLDAAEREGALARFEAEFLQGDLSDERGRYGLAIEHYERALAAAVESRDDTAIARANISLGTVEMRLGRNDAATQRFARAIERYQATGDQMRLNWALTNIGFMHILAGEHAAGIEHASRALAFFESVGNVEWIATNASNLAEAFVETGRLDEAQSMAEHALSHEDAAVRPYALTVLGRVSVARLAFDAAERILREAVAASQDASDRWAEAPALRALALALQGQGRSGDASTAFDQALAIFADLELPREIERTRALMALS